MQQYVSRKCIDDIDLAVPGCVDCNLRHDWPCPAAPWYVYNTLMKSERRVDDAGKADVIFVYDYCRLMWALSEEHAAHHW